MKIENTLKISTKFNINLGVFWFGKIKILSLNLFENRIKIFGKQVSYKRFKNIAGKIFKNKKNDKIEVNDLRKYLKILKDVNPKLEKLDLKLNIKFEDVFLTIFAIVVLSTLLTFAVNSNIKKYDNKKYKYSILPYCDNSSIIDLKGKCVISIKLLNVIKAVSMLHILHNNVFYISFYKQS